MKSFGIRMHVEQLAIFLEGDGQVFNTLFKALVVQVSFAHVRVGLNQNELRFIMDEDQHLGHGELVHAVLHNFLGSLVIL